MFLDTVNRPPRRIGTTAEDKEPSKPPDLPGFPPDSALDHDDVVAHPGQECA